MLWKAELLKRCNQIWEKLFLFYVAMAKTYPDITLIDIIRLHPGISKVKFGIYIVSLAFVHVSFVL